MRNANKMVFREWLLRRCRWQVVLLFAVASVGASWGEGVLHVAVPQGATVRLDGKEVGEASGDGLVLRDLAAGVYRVEVWRNGWRQGFGKATVSDGEVVTWVLGDDQRPRGEQSGDAVAGASGGTASLQIRTVPADCEVEIPALGMVAENKTKALWEASDLPPGEVELLLRRGDSVLSQWVVLADDVVTMVTADFPAAKTTVKTAGEAAHAAAYVKVQPRAFTAGDTAGAAHEKPQGVSAGKPFWLGVREVTVGDWRRVMGPDDVWGNDDELDPREPIAVPFGEVERFLGRLNEQAPGVGFRLPTEAEWEFTAQQGSGHGSGGATLRCAETCLFGYEGATDWEKPLYRLYPAGSGVADSGGFYDLLGNRWEWCAGRWPSITVGAVGTTSGSGDWAVARGGAFDAPRADCTPWRRLVVLDDRPMGFRLAADRNPEAGK